MAQRGTRGNSPYEKKQSEKVGRAAKAEMTPRRGEHPMVGQQRAKTVIDKGERGMSISASKSREDPGGSKFSKGGMVKRK